MTSGTEKRNLKWNRICWLVSALLAFAGVILLPLVGPAGFHSPVSLQNRFVFLLVWWMSAAFALFTRPWSGQMSPGMGLTVAALLGILLGAAGFLGAFAI